MDSPGLVLNISAVERETGLSKDVLRMWERRYGFPNPIRDENGERQYLPADVAKLQGIRRLMDIGMRPGRMMAHTLEELNALAEMRTPRRSDPLPSTIERDMLALLQSHDTHALQHAIAGLLMKQGLQRFVIDTLIPLNQAVGDAWMRGELRVFEERLYTEQMHVALRTAINAFPRQPGTPRVLLTTFPGEQHVISLLMTEAMLVSEGAQCISLGTGTPLDDIRRAVIAYNVHILALLFSNPFPVRQATDGLTGLRKQIPPQVTIWGGGEMTRRVRKTMPGVLMIPDLAVLLNALRNWRAHWTPQVPAY